MNEEEEEKDWWMEGHSNGSVLLEIKQVQELWNFFIAPQPGKDAHNHETEKRISRRL